MIKKRNIEYHAYCCTKCGEKWEINKSWPAEDKKKYYPDIKINADDVRICTCLKCQLKIKFAV